MGSNPTPATIPYHSGQGRFGVFGLTVDLPKPRLHVGHPCVKVLRPDFDAWDSFQARNPGFRIERLSRLVDKVDADAMLERTMRKGCHP